MDLHVPAAKPVPGGSGHLRGRAAAGGAAVTRLQAAGGGSAPAEDPRRGSQGEGHRLRAVAGAREQGVPSRCGWDGMLPLCSDTLGKKLSILRMLIKD